MATSVNLDPSAQQSVSLLPELSSLSRLRYFFGQLLTQRDLEAEQRYHLSIQRLFQREALGTGTVAGLRVSAAAAPAVRGVVIEPGLALDPDGRELVLENSECVDVADPPLTPTLTPFSPMPADRAALADEVAERFELPFSEDDLGALADAWVTAGLIDETQAADITVLTELLEQVPESTPDVEPPSILRDWLFSQLVGVTFVGLRYREIGVDPAPAVLDASCCGDVTCFPTRTQQGVFIATSPEPFDPAFDPYVSLKECLDTKFFGQMDSTSGSTHVSCTSALCDCLLDAWRGLPPADDPCGSPSLPVVCLASVFWSRFERSDESGPLPQLLTIDNCSCRPLAPGGPALRALVESLTGCAAPAELLPRILVVEPAEGASVAASDTDPDFTITATADAILQPAGDLDLGWQLVYYPPPGVSPLVLTPTVYPTSAGDGPGGSSASISLVDPGSPDGRVIQIAFTGGTGFPEGTYVWKIFNGSASPAVPLDAVSNDQQLDGEPNPPSAVPSGNGQPGGAFEARFVVTSDPTRR